MVAGVIGETTLALGQATNELVLASVESTASMTALVRQGVLRRLLDEERTTREALAQDLADADSTPTEADRLEVQLHHDHLPALEDEEFIEYDPRTGTVVRDLEPESIEALLDDGDS